MASKKKSSAKKKGVLTTKKRGSTALAKNENVAALLEKYASEDSAREVSGGGRKALSIRGGRFSIGDEILGDELDVVILNFSHYKAYYDAPFDPDEPHPPACFAMNLKPDSDELAPHESSPEPQAESCDECPHNRWGSAEKGRGKACKDNRRLAIIHADDLEGMMEGEEVETVILTLPPTSLKHFSSYVKQLEKRYKRPIFSVVTHLEFDEAAEHIVVLPTLGEEINDGDVLEALIARREEVTEALLAPPRVDFSDDEGDGEDKPKRSKLRGKAGKKTSAKKKTATRKKTAAKGGKRQSRFGRR